jgi:predicted metalloprotease with PDZ domain
VVDSIPGLPALEAGISPYFKIVGVNGREFSVDELKRAIHDSETNSTPIEITASNSGKLALHKLKYHKGSQFPHLERLDAGLLLSSRERIGSQWMPKDSAVFAFSGEGVDK